MRTSEVLRAAKGLIDTPEKWCQGRLGGFGRYCAVGAIREVTRTWGHVYEGAAEILRPLNRAAKEAGFRGIERLNDDAGHADVMAAFDRAIAAEEAKENPTPIAEATPAADEALSIMAACDAAAELVADAVMRQEPDYPRSTVREVAAIEIFAAAQDAAKIFPPLTPEVEAAWSEAIREVLGDSA